MSTVAVPKSAGVNFLGRFLDSALLIPLVGAGVLIYLAVLPLLMLFIGSFQMEVAPREFAYTLKNYEFLARTPRARLSPRRKPGVCSREAIRDDYC